MKGTLLFALSCLLFSTFSVAETVIYQKSYSGFTLWLDCQEHGALIFKYELGKDQGNESRHGLNFISDSSVPAECQPTPQRSFRTDAVDTERTGTYDNGHLVPANHMDNIRQDFEDTFYFTNILPQQSQFNQSGAWRLTEDISECYREITDLTIWGGVIWGDDTTDDFFVATHNIATPDYWWKIIHRHDTDDFIVWIFPNHKSAKKNNINDYIVSLNELKLKLKFSPDFGPIESRGDEKAPLSWPVSGNHDLTCEGQTTSNS